MKTSEISELNQLLNMGVAGLNAGAKDMDHLDGPAAAVTYIRVADLVSSYFAAGRIGPPVLDWGCGYGQVSWLLQERGVPVVSCDVEKRLAKGSIQELSRVDVQYLADPLRLPYDSGAFGAVLSVGVLEHVGAENVRASLQEIGRVLRPGGLFFIFMLPNRFSWVEFIANVRRVSVHPDKYTFSRIDTILKESSFTVEKKWRRNVLPRNLTGLSRAAKMAYGKHYQTIESIDGILSRFPPTSIFAGVIEVIAKRT